MRNKINWLQHSSRGRPVDPHFNADNFTHHKSIPIVSMGLQVLCEFFTSKKFQIRFWIMSGSYLVILLCYHILYHFYIKKSQSKPFLREYNFGATLKISVKDLQYCSLSIPGEDLWMLLFSIIKSGKLIRWFLISTKTLIFVLWVQLSCVVYFFLFFLCMWTVLPLAFIISCTFIPSLSLAVRTSCVFL